MKAIALAVALAVVAGWQPAPIPAARTQLVIVVDGLRPDYIDASRMPRLARLAARGIVFNAHHSVFPTVTRLNGASFVTGTYPENHGLLGNTVFVPSVDPRRGLDTGRRENLERIAGAEGRLLTAPTLSEIFKIAGKTMMALGSGTTGAVFVLNDLVSTGGIIHPDYARPAELQQQIAARFGAPPSSATPNRAQHRRVVDVYLQLVLDIYHPDVTWIWLNDPDATAHAQGMGAAATRESLAIVDSEIGRIEDSLRAGGRLDRTNLIVTSDHGFSTHTGTLRLGALTEPFARPLPDGSPDIVVAEGAIYLRGAADDRRRAALVSALQRHPAVGAIFTRPRAAGGFEGSVPGTLSFDVARWNHPRAGDILVSANWTDTADAAGIKGQTTQTGVAGHGSSSPYDIHNTLIAAGPDFRERASSEVPSSNVDIAPTLLRLLGLEVPQTMTGRVLDEGLKSGPLPASIAVTHETHTVSTADGSYQLRARISIARGKRYLDATEVIRR
jgi:arylsulfatase A-like enzyme